MAADESRRGRQSPSITVALAGDTMLGRGVAAALARAEPDDLVAPEVSRVMRQADVTVVNLECCISARGQRWPDPAKPFFFRAPPVAAEALAHLGVDAVTLANNHALDFGPVALMDTLEHLAAAGIRAVGAGPDAGSAQRGGVLEANGLRVGLLGLTDHPAQYAAGAGHPGVAYAELADGLPEWLLARLSSVEADVTLVCPHWGPNMTPAPIPRIRRAADALLDCGAALIAGHSAHIFHGVRLAADRAAAVLYDLGDFIDDYAVDDRLRNDLGLLWLVELHAAGVGRIEVLPLKLDFCRTRAARGAERQLIAELLAQRCAEFGAHVDEAPHGRLAVLPPAS